MPINVNDPEYVKAEKDYFEAGTLEERLIALRKMISHAPKHKGGENLRQQLTTRRKKLEEQINKIKKAGKSSKIGIRKGDMQAIIIGFTNVGKSSLLSILTNTKPLIASYPFTTKESIIGMMDYLEMQIQLVENPALESEYYDKSLVNTTDTILILVDNIEQIKQIQEKLGKSNAKQIIIFNKIDKLSEQEHRKISATLQSKKYNFILISTKTKQNIEELKEKIFKSFDSIRIFTKEPGKEKSPKPVIIKPNSTVGDIAEKILKGFSKKIKQTKIWGPSSKFAGQSVGLKHKLKDLDVVEFRTN